MFIIPNEVIRGYQLKDNVSMNGQKYQLSSKDQFPFKEIGLPEVGSIVTVSNNYTSFYRNSSIEFISDALSKHRNIEYDKERKIAEVNAFYNPAFQMTVGSKLKVLGYKNFNFKGIQDKLFVQIQYISDK